MAKAQVRGPRGEHGIKTRRIVPLGPHGHCHVTSHTLQRIPCSARSMKTRSVYTPASASTLRSAHNLPTTHPAGGRVAYRRHEGALGA